MYIFLFDFFYYIYGLLSHLLCAVSSRLMVCYQRGLPRLVFRQNHCFSSVQCLLEVLSLKKTYICLASLYSCLGLFQIDVPNVHKIVCFKGIRALLKIARLLHNGFFLFFNKFITLYFKQTLLNCQTKNVVAFSGAVLLNYMLLCDL